MSTTASTDDLLIKASIEAHEEHDVAIPDITGVFFHTETDKDVIMLLGGLLADLVVKLYLNL